MNDRNDSPAVTKPVQPARRRLLKAAGIAAGGAALSARLSSAMPPPPKRRPGRSRRRGPRASACRHSRPGPARSRRRPAASSRSSRSPPRKWSAISSLLDGVKNGVLEAMNSFTVYWAARCRRRPSFQSYLMGLRYPHEWDIFFYSKGGLQAAREIFAKQGLYYVEPHPPRPEHHPLEEADPHRSRISRD